MMPDFSARSMRKHNDFGKDLSSLSRQQEDLSEREKELSLYRSGSAPPTVEGSLSSFGGIWEGSRPLGLEKLDDERFVSEEELRADQEHANYYYSNANPNPPHLPPLNSKDWRFKERFQGSGRGVGGRRHGSRENGDDEAANGTLFSFTQGKRGNEDSDFGSREVAGKWGDNAITGLPWLSFGSRQKSFAEIIQNDLNDGTAISRQPSRAASRNAFDANFEVNDGQSAYLHKDISSINELDSGGNKDGISGVGESGSLASQTYAAALGTSKSRSSTPDPRLVGIAPVGVGRVNSVDRGVVCDMNSINGVLPGFNGDLADAFSGMNLSVTSVLDEKSHARLEIQNKSSNYQNIFNLTGNPSQKTSFANNDGNEKFHAASAHPLAKGSHRSNALLMADEQLELNKPATLSTKFYAKESSTLVPNDRPLSLSHYEEYVKSFSNYGLSGYAINPSSPSMMRTQTENGSFPALFEDGSAMGVSAINSRAPVGGLPRSHLLEAASELQNIGRFREQSSPFTLHSPLMDPLYLQYLKLNEYNAAHIAVLSDHTLDMDRMGNSRGDLFGIQDGYLGASFATQELQFSSPDSFGNHPFGPMSYPQRPFSGHLLPNYSTGLDHPMRYSDHGLHVSSGMRNYPAGIHGARTLESGGYLDESLMSSLLDEFKNNKTKCFELSEIAGHVVDFSADQYGSRFIQQKLETASTEEKNMVFHEIFPQALSLMTDVFGNYVIQKFFEHGSALHVRELAEQLTGHVLALSLQMYGCRVIQKAIEVVNLDQQIKMVNELDGQVMRCVRDQNGNHVIQKCIECVPENVIHFIVSTVCDQVLTLSTHPYGCRVIQRVLEHCHDPKTQHLMMDEILQSVCLLAQDQYGNYVVQHVLEHGEEQERSAIINKLVGQIVQMSQQKFASNVVEKCLTFGTAGERQMLVNEMLGSSDENEPLQAMMKDQFGNYVVQKVLETCDDQQLELILNRIKVHLTALRKYTYGKHIVARLEKLVAAGGMASISNLIRNELPKKLKRRVIFCREEDQHSVPTASSDGVGMELYS